MVIRHSSTPATLATIVAGLILTLVACQTATPPVATPPGATPPVATPSMVVAAPHSTTPAGSPTPSHIPDFGSLVDLGLELDIDVLGPEQASDILDFASDGRSVVFSSGAAVDVATTDAAPDLWAVAPGREPEMIWKNPSRDHSLALVGGDLGTYAFVDIPLTGARSWTLYVIPDEGEDAIVLDEHPGAEDIPSFVPSFSIYERKIVWTSFDRGPDGPVSQLLWAGEPAWEPEVLLEVPSSEAELWLPSLYGAQLAYTEVRYNEDRSDDERSVWLMNIYEPGKRERLDTTGRATMPLRIGDAVFWKQAQRGYNMFNWGHMYRHDVATSEVEILDLAPQTFVNYPSAGERFVAWWGADSFQFGVYDHLREEPRAIESNPPGSNTNVLRPHLHSDLLVWMRVVGSETNRTRELRYAYLPDAGDLRGTSP